MRYQDETRSEITVDYQGGKGASDSDYTTLRTEWTNEKHCLYIKSMEASFVNELLKGQANKYVLKKGSTQQIKNIRNSGSWKNASLYKHGNKLGATSKSRSLVVNPRIRHFRRADDRKRNLETTISQDIDVNPDQEMESKLFNRVGSNSKSLTTTLSVLYRKNAASSNTEMMDQNFDGNDDQVIKPRLSRPKWKKVEMTSDSDNDLAATTTVPRRS